MQDEPLTGYVKALFTHVKPFTEQDEPHGILAKSFNSLIGHLIDCLPWGKYL